MDLTPIDKLGPKEQHTVEHLQCGNPVIAGVYIQNPSALRNGGSYAVCHRAPGRPRRQGPEVMVRESSAKQKGDIVVTLVKSTA
jgi:hypothetical protein